MNDETILKEFREKWIRQLQSRTDIHLRENETLLIERHFQLMMKWNKVHNLTAVNEVESLVSEHYLDCVIALSLFMPSEDSSHIYDLGSGNGLPGLIGAILFPHLKFELVESSRKKCSFLRFAAAELRLRNVTVNQQRVEALTGISRAITRAAFSEPNINDLSNLFEKNGRLTLMTVPSFPSPNWTSQNSPWMIEARYSYVLPSGAPRSVVVLKKNAGST